jgi:hypothetical protein
LSEEIEYLRDEINTTTDIFYKQLNNFKGKEVESVIVNGYKFRDKILSLKLLKGKEIEENFNKIIEIYRDVLSLPEMFAELITPNSTKTVSPIADDIANLMGTSLNLPTKNKVFNYLDNLYVKDLLFAAKNMMAPLL